MSEISAIDIDEVLTGIMARADAVLNATPENELSAYWAFAWDDARSIEWNVYMFSCLLEMYKRTCRRWEEKHNGTCCVVERVRDKYVMSRVSEFLAELAKHSAYAPPSTEAAYAMGAKGGPVVEAERLAFEAWMRGHCWELGADWDGTGYTHEKEGGNYVDPGAMRTRQLFAAWRDRAALAHQ